jgi:CRISPR-associated protein Cas2
VTLCVVITRDVPDRFHGFLASCMLEVAPGIYTAPGMRSSIRERIWTILTDWFDSTGGGSIVLTWDDAKSPTGVGLKFLGHPVREIINYDGALLVRKR